MGVVGEGGEERYGHFFCLIKVFIIYAYSQFDTVLMGVNSFHYTILSSYFLRDNL